jgi:hypothetical protein
MFPALMNERHHRFSGHVAAENQNIHFVEFPRIQELVPANIRTMNVCRKKQFGHGRTLRKGNGLALSLIIPVNEHTYTGKHGNKEMMFHLVALFT